ncbi:MAG: hypothetical protein ACLUKN_17300 [Bacilli bacterium]
MERHMAILDLWRAPGDSAIRRLARKVGRIDRLVRIDKADRNGRPREDPGRLPQGEWIMARAEAEGERFSSQTHYYGQTPNRSRA